MKVLQARPAIAVSCVLMDLINQQSVCVLSLPAERRPLRTAAVLRASLYSSERASVAPQHKINSALDSLFYANIKPQMITMTRTFLLALGHDRKAQA